MKDFMKTHLPSRLALTLTLALSTLTLSMSGCSLLRVYTIDIPQGSKVTQSQAIKVQQGMSETQVLYLLGSPTFKDTMQANRWDYIYDYQAGTVGRREGKTNIHKAQQHLKVYFIDGKVSQVTGINSLPQK